jgi:hypothetical protein
VDDDSHAQAARQAPSYVSPTGAYWCWRDTLWLPYSEIEISSSPMDAAEGWKCHWVDPADQNMSLHDWIKVGRTMAKVRRLILLLGA